MFYSVASVVTGSWYDHVNGWWNKKQTYPNLHYMFFEDLVEVVVLWLFSCLGLFSEVLKLVMKQWCIWPLCFQDTGRKIDKLCSFLGLSPSEEEKKQVTGGVQFDKMKKNKMTNYSTHSRMDFKTGSFMRKGRENNHILHKKMSFQITYLTDCLCVCRPGWWLEKTFYCGPEWRVWWRLQEKDEGPHTSVPHWNWTELQRLCSYMKMDYD